MTAPWFDKARERLAHINVLSLDELRRLPDAAGPFDAGLYFLWRGEELLWIGKSEQILSRIARRDAQRRFDGVWLSERKGIPFDRYTCLVLQEEGPRLKALLQDYERAYIAVHDPPYNHTDANGGT